MLPETPGPLGLTPTEMDLVINTTGQMNLSSAFALVSKKRKADETTNFVPLEGAEIKRARTLLNDSSVNGED
jgi:hypothetical protein